MIREDLLELLVEHSLAHPDVELRAHLLGRNEAEAELGRVAYS